MIGYIKGKLLSREEDRILIENGGIGFEVYVPDPGQFVSLQGDSPEVEVWTAMIVREDDISLYGFRQKADLMLFKKLLNVNGVGAKAALAILSVMKAEALSRAIVFEDIDSITRAPGIGKKTAQRIVLELKDKLGDLPGLGQGDISLAGAGRPAGEGTVRAGCQRPLFRSEGPVRRKTGPRFRGRRRQPQSAADQ